MKAVQLPAYGDADVLEVVEVEAPAAQDGRARVHVEARLVNPSDGWIRAGAFAAAFPNLPFPAVLGWDFSGTLLDDAPVPPAVAPSGVLPAGTRVAGYVPWFDEALGKGTYAEVISVDPAWIAPVPDDLGAAEAAVVAMNSLTGAQAADLFGDVAGGTYLVTGASGPVGASAARTLVDRGARVLVTGSRGDDEALAALGAEVLPRAGVPETVAALRGAAPDGIDGVFDAALVGGGLLAAVRDGGTYISATKSVVPEPERGIVVDGVYVRPDAVRVVALFAEAVAGRLPVRVAAELPLAEAANAQRLLEKGGVRGKLVLVS